SEWYPSSTDKDNSTWQAYRYELTGSLAFAVGHPVKLLDDPQDNMILINSALKFVSKHASDLGVDGCDFSYERINDVRGMRVVLLRPEINGIPVYGAYTVLSVNKNGELSMIKAKGFGSKTTGYFGLSERDILSIAIATFSNASNEAETRKVYLPVRAGVDKIELRACWEVLLETSEADLQPTLFIDAISGAILASENRVYYERLEGHSQGWYKPLYRRDDLVRGAFPNEWMRFGAYGDNYSDEDGDFVYNVNPDVLPQTLHTELRGRWVDVDYEDGADARISIEIRNVEALEVTWTPDNSRDDERSLYYHTNFIHSFWKDLDSGFNGLDRVLLAVCMYGNNYDNAFYNGQGMYFGGGNEMDNFALYSDIVYHEYCHGVTGHIYPRDILPYRGESGALNEAWSDYFPCSISDEPYMGEGGLRGNGYIRHLDNNLVYPIHLQGEVHRDSRIISAAMWHSREILGLDITDPLFHYSRYELGNTFFTYFTDVLLTDDNDGDITNGTPHYRTLYEQFGRHGIGPGIQPKILFSQIELFDDNQDGANGDDDSFWEAGETIRIEMELYRKGSLYPPPAEDVRVIIHSEDDNLNLIQNEVHFGDMRVDDHNRNEQPLMFRIADDTPLCFTEVIFEIFADDDNIIRRDTLNIPLGHPDLLLVKDGEEGKDQTRYYTDALAESGVVYSSFSTAESIMSLERRIAGINNVIWFSGDAQENILTTENRQVLSEFLAEGGNLLLTGQSLGESPGSEDFFNNYFGARHISDSLHQVWIEGVTDDPVGQGLGLLLAGARGARNQIRPAAIVAVGEGVEIYHWTRVDNTPAAGVRREDTETGSRTVYLSFGVEGVGGHGNTGKRAEVIRHVLNWFGVETSVEENLEAVLPAGFYIGTPYPNPFNHAINIPIRLNLTGEVKLSVFDLTGRRLWTGIKTLNVGQSVWTISGENWGSGVFIIKVESPDGSRNVKIVMMK
ncbi:MAG: T9SS type A sorting domain-containing protein, partial [Calditrichaeota bacterium]|nr:T9SS type A sorting domain-containing protein [Calditrichota bacterium]